MIFLGSLADKTCLQKSPSCSKVSILISLRNLTAYFHQWHPQFQKFIQSILLFVIFSIFEDTTENNWITVFGFSPSVSQQVIDYFVRLGQVIAKDISKDGNFVHLKYASCWDVQRALSKNGFLIDGIHIIGVMPMRPTTTTLGFTKSPFQSSEFINEDMLRNTESVKLIESNVSQEPVEDIFLKTSHKNKPQVRTIDEGELLTRRPSMYERIINFFIK